MTFYLKIMQKSLVGIVVPQEEAIRRLSESNSFKQFSFAQLCEGSDPALKAPEAAELARAHHLLKAAILDSLHSFGKQAGLLKFEQVL